MTPTHITDTLSAQLETGGLMQYEIVFHAPDLCTNHVGSRVTWDSPHGTFRMIVVSAAITPNSPNPITYTAVSDGGPMFTPTTKGAA